MQIPRILFTAGMSGAGKTMITCGFLRCLKKRNKKVTAFKCGPDYIDPMFHREVLGIESYNLDSFLCGKENLPALTAEHAKGSDIAVMEGVMGYFDGLGGISSCASTYEVAYQTDTPAILIVDGRGASVSLVPYIQGFLQYRQKETEGSRIKGVILNKVSPMFYGRIKELIEKETKVRVYGYVPVIDKVIMESRHLGLKMPGEMKNFREQFAYLGDMLEKTLDIDGLLELAASAPELKGEFPARASAFEEKDRVRIGLAKDEAFCFCYEDNLEVLKRLGGEIVPFSPIYDSHLPEELDGILFYGGYPELYADVLSANESMRREVSQAVKGGLPCIAECGGFQYLQEVLETEDGMRYEMAGVFKGKSFWTASLKRFGYVTLEGGTVFGQDVGFVPAHEFHYYDSEECGDSFVAQKPLSERFWNCIISTDTILAGYPHLHYVGNPKVAEAFLRACRRRRR